MLLGYAPATERDHRLLQNLYNLFDGVRKLDYWLRPHVTLAYFRPRVPTMQEVQELVRRLETLGPGPELSLPVWELAYQRFEHEPLPDAIHREKRLRTKRRPRPEGDRGPWPLRATGAGSGKATCQASWL